MKKSFILALSLLGVSLAWSAEREKGEGLKKDWSFNFSRALDYSGVNRRQLRNADTETKAAWDKFMAGYVAAFAPRGSQKLKGQDQENGYAIALELRVMAEFERDGEIDLRGFVPVMPVCFRKWRAEVNEKKLKGSDLETARCLMAQGLLYKQAKRE